MSSCCTLRLKRRNAFSRDSPSCNRTSANGTTPPNLSQLTRYLLQGCGHKSMLMLHPNTSARPENQAGRAVSPREGTILRFVISEPTPQPYKKNAGRVPCTRPEMRFPQGRLKESQRLWAVTYHHALGLLAVIKDHLVGLATETRLFVSAERGMRRIQVIAVCPHPASLDFPAYAISVRGIA